MSTPESSTSRNTRVVVIAGGLSHERDVSLRSGRRVSEALRTAGFEVEERDVDAALLRSLVDDRPDCVFPLLHGENGEDGSIREVLELLKLPYVGSDAAACRLSFDKPIAKTLIREQGIQTPDAVALPHETFRELGAASVMELLLERIGLPLVVKPTKGGSSLGCTVVHQAADLPGAMVGSYAYGPVALVERFVAGTEVAVSVVDRDGKPTALPAVAINPSAGVYDYSARYTAGETEFVVPAPLPTPVLDRCAEVAATVHRALGLRHISRSDLIVDDAGEVWFLEVNVAPGMTETSLVPLAVERSPSPLDAVLADLVDQAIG